MTSPSALLETLLIRFTSVGWLSLPVERAETGRPACGCWAGSWTGLGLEPLVGKVNHHEVLVGVAVHEDFAALGIDDNTLDAGDEAQGPLERFHAAHITQARNLQPQRSRHRLSSCCAYAPSQSWI